MDRRPFEVLNPNLACVGKVKVEERRREQNRRDCDSHHSRGGKAEA